MADSKYLNRRLQLDFEGTDEDTSYTTKGVNAVACTFNNGAKLEATGAITGTTSLYCDGIDDYVSIPDDADLVNINRDKFCIEFDYKSVAGSAPGSNTILISKGDQNVNQSWRIIYNSSLNAIFFVASWNGTASYQVFFAFDSDASGGIDLFDGLEHHITMYRLSSTNRLYLAVDGNVAADTEFVDRWPTRNIDEPILIGAGKVSGSITQHQEGLYDNLRITIGTDVYTATTGTFTPDTRPFDLVDAGNAASYAYPLAISEVYKDAENYGKAGDGALGWIADTDLGSNRNHMMPVTAGDGGPSPQAGSASFSAGTINIVGNPGNADFGSSYTEVDLTRYDSQFLDDVDAGLLKIVMGGYAYIETSGDGLLNMACEFYDELGALIGRCETGGVIPTAASWGYFEEQQRVPPDTRTLKIFAQGKKDTNVYADTRFFLDSLVFNLAEQGYSGTDSHVLTYFADTAEMVANWTPQGGTVSTTDKTTTAGAYFGEAMRTTSSLAADGECESPMQDLISGPTDIDAGSVDYYFRTFMANNGDTCSAWIEFYAGDGLTIVGSRISSASATRGAYGEIVELTGTIPATARKVKIGYDSTDGSSGSNYYARDAMLMEVGPPATGGSGGGQGAISTVIIVG